VLERISDETKIREVLTHESIFEAIGGTDKDFPIPIDNDHHYLYMEGGLFILHPSGEDWMIHANVLPEYRGKAYEAGQEAFEYAFNTLGAARVVASIPPKYSNVYKFALKSGMCDRGLIEGDHYLTLEHEKWVL
jgi:hypothetical protein